MDENEFLIIAYVFIYLILTGIFNLILIFFGLGWFSCICLFEDYSFFNKIISCFINSMVVVPPYFIAKKWKEKYEFD